MLLAKDRRGLTSCTLSVFRTLIRILLKAANPPLASITSAILAALTTTAILVSSVLPAVILVTCILATEVLPAAEVLTSGLLCV